MSLVKKPISFLDLGVEMFSKLPKEIKELVVRGVYSLFELKEPYDGYSFVLVKSDDTGLLLTDDGLKPKPISNLEYLKLGKLITINDVSIPDSVIVNNAAF